MGRGTREGGAHNSFTPTFRVHPKRESQYPTFHRVGIRVTGLPRRLGVRSDSIPACRRLFFRGWQILRSPLDLEPPMKHRRHPRIVVDTESWAQVQADRPGVEDLSVINISRNLSVG